MNYLKVFVLSSLISSLFFAPGVAWAANYTSTSVHQTVLVYNQFNFSRLLASDALIKIGVGILASILFVISALAWWRDRRTKFLVVCLSFLAFTLKGLLGLADLLFPGDSSFLVPFSDSFDFIILLLLFIAVLKD